jgi:endonuclease G
MNRSHLHAYPNCKKKEEEVDAKQAFERLSQKLTQLGEQVAQYMSEAPLERNLRNRNAETLAKRIDRIVGGRPVKPGRYPECCLIGESFSNRTQRWFCTGVLIHPRIVVTAAHCHTPPELRANIVALRAENQDLLANAELRSARRTRINPKYPQTGLNDIAVLILRRASTIQPVPIASSAEINTANAVMLVGFGNDDINSTRGFGIKRVVNVPIISIRRNPGQNLDTDEQMFGYESDLEFVAGGNGFDSCNGDSGGPAYIRVGGVRKLAGLTSRGTKTATNPCGDGGIYTRIDVHMDFIRNVACAFGIQL